MIPLDIDVSCMNNSGSKKEGVSRTYRGYWGYAPIFAWLARDGYLINVELRKGSQHCQDNTPEFLEQTIAYTKQVTDSPILLRMDSGNDSIDNIKICLKENINWLIKRNIRRTPKEHWLNIAKEHGKMTHMRDGKTLWEGCITQKHETLDEDLTTYFKVTEETITSDGQIHMTPEIEVEIYWSNLSISPDKIFRLYHEHGESEQYHSEIKTDIGLERLPSKYFTTNKLILDITLLACNLLRILAQNSNKFGTHLKKSAYRKTVTRRRLKTIIQDLMLVAARIFTKQGHKMISFGRCCPWEFNWKAVYTKLSKDLNNRLAFSSS